MKEIARLAFALGVALLAPALTYLAAYQNYFWYGRDFSAKLTLAVVAMGAFATAWGGSVLLQRPAVHSRCHAEFSSHNHAKYSAT